MPIAEFAVHPAAIGFVAVIFSQTSLLGLWIGLGADSWQRRLGGFLAGLVYLAFLLACVISPRAKALDEPLATRFCAVIAVTALLLSLSTAAILTLARRRGARLCRLEPGVAPHVGKEIRFTIAHLMLLTAVVAAFLALGQSMRDLARVTGTSHGPVFVVVAFVCCLVSVSLAAAWAALSQGSPLARSMLVVVMAVCVGLIPPYYFRWGWRDYVAVPATICLQAILSTASLLIVRSWGYRLDFPDARKSTSRCSLPLSAHESPR
ncbi:MAG: hypothetical protein ACYTG0_32795 [Planctomycetota bacterium]